MSEGHEDTVMFVLHEVCPLYSVCERPKVPADVYREYLKDPSIRVLICQRPCSHSISADIKATYETHQSKSNTISCF
jgi:hypothetical protein